MPRRKRIAKRRNLLTLERDLMLSLGPRPGEPAPAPGDPELEALRHCFEKYRYGEDGRDRYGPGTWGHRAFVEGVVETNPLIPADD
jgi:hypothetical protein